MSNQDPIWAIRSVNTIFQEVISDLMSEDIDATHQDFENRINTVRRIVADRLMLMKDFGPDEYDDGTTVQFEYRGTVCTATKLPYFNTNLRWWYSGNQYTWIELLELLTRGPSPVTQMSVLTVSKVLGNT